MASTCCFRICMRSEISASFSNTGVNRGARKFSSSTNLTARPRRIVSCRQAARRSSSGLVFEMAIWKSLWFSTSSRRTVFTFGGIRCKIRFFSAVLVTDTSIVRSNRNSPSRTFSNAVTAAWSMKSVPSMLYRYLDRAASIRLAAAISWSLLSKGISPICMRYMRTGSSIAIGEAEPSPAASSSSPALDAVGFLAERPFTSDLLPGVAEAVSVAFLTAVFDGLTFVTWHSSMMVDPIRLCSGANQKALRMPKVENAGLC